MICPSVIASSSRSIKGVAGLNFWLTTRRNFLPQSASTQRQRKYTKMMATVSTITSTKLARDCNNNSRNYESNKFWWISFLAAASFGIGASSDFKKTQFTRLEDAKNNSAVDFSSRYEQREQEEADPYDNLPDTDEPTHCSICLTYRQGPCRPYWRKVEACTKDNELNKEEGPAQEEEKEARKSNDEGPSRDKGEEEEDMIPNTPCLKYMLPWIDCATGFKNLYSLIELDTNYTEGIANLEKEAVKTLCWASGKEPNIDWTPWQRYVLSHEDWTEPYSNKSEGNNGTGSGKSISLWRTLDQNLDPELVEIQALVPSKEGAGILECAFAVDQNGNVIGFTYGTKPIDAVQREGDETNPEKSSMVDLKIKLLPNLTRNITIKASYTQTKKVEDNGANDKAEDAPLDAHVYHSRSYSLEKMANLEA